MDQEPRRAARDGANRDGLAALAIVVLTVTLVALVISKIV